jgi:RND family efflux transporter MFP subunit
VQASLAAKKQQVLAHIAQAEADVTQADVLASFTKITSPFGGIVVAKPAVVGALAAPGLPLLVVEEERYLLEAAVEESAVGYLRVGQTVPVTVEALGHRTAGALLEVVPTADPTSRTFTVKVALPPLPLLRSGLFGRAQFSTGQHTALLVPQTALVARGPLQGVFVLAAHNQAVLRLVKTGRAHQTQIEIVSGLEEGERVVVENVRAVQEGDVVADQHAESAD